MRRLSAVLLLVAVTNCGREYGFLDRFDAAGDRAPVMDVAATDVTERDDLRDAAIDAGSDAGSDVGLDVRVDDQPDARPDVQPDARADVQPDVRVDDQPDVRPDVPLDVPTDVRLDVVTVDARDAASGDAADAISCGALTLCGGRCVDTRDDTSNCGGCGNRCTGGGPNSVPVCVTGACQYDCVPDFGDCNRTNIDGCETDLLTTRMHCGTCGMRCRLIDTCEGGLCTMF